MSESIEEQQAPTVLVLAEVLAERANQDHRWGEQNHPSLWGESFRRTFERSADRWKAINGARVNEDSITWDGILLEEVFEALAEGDEQKIREELVQTAAVAVAWIESIDRRTDLPPSDEDELGRDADDE